MLTGGGGGEGYGVVTGGEGEYGLSIGGVGEGVGEGVFVGGSVSGLAVGGYRVLSIVIVVKGRYVSAFTGICAIGIPRYFVILVS